MASPAAAVPALTGGANTDADRHAHSALFAAVLGFFVITLDAVVVNVTLLAAMMVLVGLGGPTVSPPATAVLLDAVPHQQAGVASGVFNTAHQVGGALAVAVFGGLLADPDTLVRGVRTSLLLAATVLALTSVLALYLPSTKEMR